MAELSVAIYASGYVPQMIERSVKSAVSQSLDSMEIILIDDCRTSAESRYVKSTFKKIKKSLSLPYGKGLRFLSMGRSVGIPDSLRAAVDESSGRYFTVLMMGDVFYDEKSLSALLELSSRNASIAGEDWDLVQGKVVPDEKDESVLKVNPNAYDIIERNAPGELRFENPDDFTVDYFMGEKFSLCLEGKLFIRSALEDMFLRMPRVECHIAVEYLWMYFFCRQSRTLISTGEKVCTKYMDFGPDAGDFKIETPGRWMKLCSAASAFSAVFFDMMDYPLESRDFGGYMRSIMTRYALSNVKSLVRVDPSIRTVCEAILSECWGDEIVSDCKAWIESSDGKKTDGPET